MTAIHAARVAARLRSELHVDVDMVHGRYGEFRVLADGKALMEGGKLAFLGVLPSAQTVVSAVSAHLAALADAIRHSHRSLDHMLPHRTSRPTIYPYPQWATFGDGAFHVGRSAATVWLDPALSGPALPQAIGDLPMAATAAASAGEATIAIGLASNGALASRLGAATTGFVPPPEGYRLVVGPDRITVLGADSVGCYYGLCALGQVLRADGEQVTAAVGEVRDWPYKPMRGVHVYMPGRDGIPFFKDLLAWLASMRYNMVFLEVGGGMRYDRHPEVNEAWERFSREVWAYPGGARGLQGSQPYPKDSTHTELGHGSFLEKAEVADIIAHANAYGIEVVPELQSLSHAYYMCLAHPEIAERRLMTPGRIPTARQTLAPTSSTSICVDEVIEVFRPRMLHIGHDEALHDWCLRPVPWQERRRTARRRPDQGARLPRRSRRPHGALGRQAPEHHRRWRRPRWPGAAHHRSSKARGPTPCARPTRPWTSCPKTC